jgi:hypothetical protein
MSTRINIPQRNSSCRVGSSTTREHLRDHGPQGRVIIGFRRSRRRRQLRMLRENFSGFAAEGFEGGQAIKLPLGPSPPFLMNPIPNDKAVIRTATFWMGAKKRFEGKRNVIAHLHFGQRCWTGRPELISQRVTHPPGWPPPLTDSVLPHPSQRKAWERIMAQPPTLRRRRHRPKPPHPRHFDRGAPVRNHRPNNRESCQHRGFRFFVLCIRMGPLLRLLPTPRFDTL